MVIDKAQTHDNKNNVIWGTNEESVSKTIDIINQRIARIKRI